jgi:hypothetical protein
MSRLAFLPLVWLIGCGGARLPEPPFGPHVIAPNDWVRDLEAPPPTVEAEEVTAPPSAKHVWIDGQWSFQPLNKRWVWSSGGWCEPPARMAYYARPAVERYRILVGRVSRWNEALQRFEEVDSGDDRWKWARGRFYVKDARGVIVPSPDDPKCVAADSH